MKLSKILLLLSFVLALTALTSRVSAQLIAYDEAGNYLANANWTNGANQGFGFTPWMIVTNGPDFKGTYIASANVPAFVIDSVTNILTTNYTSVFGLFANGPTDVNTTTAFRGFANSLGTNTFKVQWGSRGAGSTVTTNSGTVHGWCGFSLRNGNTTNSASDFQTGTMLYIYFLDGNNPSTIYFWDGNGVQSVPNTSFSDLGRNNITNAIEAEITPGADGQSYHMVLKDSVVGRVILVTNSIFIGGGTVDSVALFCQETTGDQVYNRLQITSSTNLPPTIVNVQPADGSLYLPAGSTSLSFEVDSFNSTVMSNAVSLYLNGVQQPASALSYNTTSPTTQLLGNCTATLAPDTFYNYTIVARDANGNVVSNNFTFNTFLSGDMYIDAYDYNYGSGSFIDGPTPVNAFANLLGTNGVDYLIADLTGTNNTAGYRPGDLPEILPLPTDNTGDPVDHANLRANGHTAYNIGFTDTGNWENYTRTFPSANYNIYARAASAAGAQFEVERLANATATTTTQPLIALGRLNVPNTGGSKVFSGQLTPVTDVFGNPVVVPLSGVTTLRETALQSRTYNLEYFLAVSVPGAGTLRPYIATGSPAPGSTGAALLGPVTFSIANRQTSVVTNTLQLFVNNTNVSSRLVMSSNLVGVTASWTPTNNLPSNATNTVTVIFTDSGGVSVTNSWTFITGTTGGLQGNGLWSGGGGANDMFWADGINWTGGTPSPGFTASFATLGATATLVTNNIVATNVTILGLFYNTNNTGFHTTWIEPGVTLTVSNNTTATTAAVQVGGTTGGDNSFSKAVTNTITGSSGTLLVLGNSQASGQANALNFQVRQNAVSCPPNLVTLDMSGLGTMIATVGKFYIAQGGTGAAQTNSSGCVNLAMTNIITCLRANNAGQFEVGDSSGGAFVLPGSTLNLGITNSFYVDTARFGKQKATNNLIRFYPAFTNLTACAALVRGTNGPNSRVTTWTIGDADAETTVPNFVQANMDFSGGRLDAMVNTMILARGETAAADTGTSVGTLTLNSGTLDVFTLQVGVQRAVSTATETGVISINGGAAIVSTNIILAQTNAGANASLVTGMLNITNGAIRGNIFSGGGNSTVNLNNATLVVSNNAGTAAAPLAALNLTGAAVHLKVDGNVTTTPGVNAAAVSASGSTITIDSVANVSGSTTIRLIKYSGSDPFAGLSLAALPGGYSGNLVDDTANQTIDLSINIGAPVPPTISKISINAGSIILSGTNNTGQSGTYHVLTTTNLAVPLASWLVSTNGSFDANGNFMSTNAIGTGGQQFYIIKVP